MKKILIIGAGFLQDFVITKARELGYYTIAIDGNPYAIGLKHADESAVIDIVDPKACYEFAKDKDIQGVLTAATDFGVLAASYVAEKLHLPGLNYAAAKRIKNKYEVRKKLIEACADDMQEAFEVDKNIALESLNLHYPVMVKPCDGSGSRATMRVDCAKDLAYACHMAMEASLKKKALIETFVQGNEYGAESLVVNGEIHVLGIMKKWMTKPPYYAELGHQIPSELPAELENKAIECVRNTIKALDINHGAVNMDLIINKKGEVHIVDVGARMGGNMIGPCIIPSGTGINYMENLIKTAVGDTPDWSSTQPEKVATRLLAFKGGRIKRLPDFDALSKQYGVSLYHHMNVGDVVNEYHSNLDGCGYIVAKDSETADRVLTIISEYIF